MTGPSTLTPTTHTIEDTRWQNWHQSVTQQVARLMDLWNAEPNNATIDSYNATTAALQGIVAEAEGVGMSLRGLGGGWSFTPVAATTGIMLNTKPLNYQFKPGRQLSRAREQSRLRAVWGIDRGAERGTVCSGQVAPDIGGEQRPNNRRRHLRRDPRLCPRCRRDSRLCGRAPYRDGIRPAGLARARFEPGGIPVPGRQGGSSARAQRRAVRRSLGEHRELRHHSWSHARGR